MDDIVVGSIRDLGRDLILAQDALTDAFDTLDGMDEIDDLDAAAKILAICSDVVSKAATVHDVLAMRLELSR